MQKLAAFIIATAGFFATANTAFATWIAPVGPSICTRDFNPWGQASQCQCPHATRYESRLGQCVQGAPIATEVKGTVAATRDEDGVVVAYTLTTEDKLTYKIVLPVALRESFEDQSFLDNTFQVSGEVLENFDGTPIETPTIILEKLDLVKADKAGECLWPARRDLEVLYEDFGIELN